jgi:hypothetical protein
LYLLEICVAVLSCAKKTIIEHSFLLSLSTSLSLLSFPLPSFSFPLPLSSSLLPPLFLSLSLSPPSFPLLPPSLQRTIGGVYPDPFIYSLSPTRKLRREKWRRLILCVPSPLSL